MIQSPETSTNEKIGFDVIGMALLGNNT